MLQRYVKYSLYIQSYYFNFTFARASLWRVQLLPPQRATCATWLCPQNKSNNGVNAAHLSTSLW